ncbi:MAG: internal scaffolding protein [Microviridae sp.]|nr:MAG: internal scaffolding protein [Microviridae sp.]
MSIDSYAPYTDLNYMLHRLSVGDTSVLSGRKAMYGDFSQLPQNPVDMINVLNSAEQSFSQLPSDEKVAFNNDYRVWLAHMLDSVSNPVVLDSPADSSDSPVKETSDES